MVSDMEKVRLELQWDDGWRKRLIIRAGAHLINAMFHDRRIGWEVSRDKMVSRCGPSGMSLDDDK